MYFIHLDNQKEYVANNSDKYIPYEPLPEDLPKKEEKELPPFYYYEHDKEKDARNRYYEKINWYNRTKKSTYKPFFWGWLISLIISFIIECLEGGIIRLSDTIIIHIFSSFIWIPICSFISIHNIEVNHRERVDKRIETPEQRARDIAEEAILGTTALRYMNEGRKFSIKPKNEKI